MEANRAQNRGRKTKRRIKKAALGIFSQKTVDSTTVEEITERAEVAKGTLYNYFADKDQVVIELVDDALSNLINRIREGTKDSSNFKEALENIISAHLGFFEESREEFVLLFQGKLFLKLEVPNMTDMEQAYNRYLIELESQIRRFSPDTISAQRLKSMACAIAGFIFGSFSFTLIRMNDEGLKSTIHHVKEAIFKGVSVYIEE